MNLCLLVVQCILRDVYKRQLSGNAFGEAGSRVVIEEFLDGEEASFIVMVDGKNVEPMATSQDHKRVGENDTGLNTGGMGAYSPAPVVTPEIHDRIIREVIYPTVNGMAAEGNVYTGFLYAGLMLSLIHIFIDKNYSEFKTTQERNTNKALRLAK